jgi:hypothetical protein
MPSSYGKLTIGPVARFKPPHCADKDTLDRAILTPPCRARRVLHDFRHAVVSAAALADSSVKALSAQYGHDRGALSPSGSARRPVVPRTVLAAAERRRAQVYSWPQGL